MKTTTFSPNAMQLATEAVERLRERVRYHRERRRVRDRIYREMETMTPRELGDLGISRYDLGRLANEHADRTVPAPR